MPQFTAPKYDYKKCVMCQGGSWAEFKTNSSVIICEPCKKSTESVSPSPESFSTSTPVLASMATSRSTLTSSTKTNPYFQFQRTRRSSMFNPTEGHAPTNTAIIQSPPQSPILDRITEKLNNKANLNYRRTGSATTTTTTMTPSSPVTTNTPTPSPPARKKKLIKKPCKECGQHVSKKDYRGLKIPSGEVLCYHQDCLFCARCEGNFDSLDFCTDGKKFYHVECPQQIRRSTPLSEEEEPFPSTPPAHHHHFDIAALQDGDELQRNNQLPNKKDIIIPDSSTDIMCYTCAQPVTDSTCLELTNHFYHKEVIKKKIYFYTIYTKYSISFIIVSFMCWL